MIALVDERINDSSLLSLKRIGAEPFLMPPSPLLQKGVASHPDMLVFVGFGKLFCHENYYEANKNLIDAIIAASHLELTLSNEEFSENYPHDVKFNAALVGNTLICNKKTVSQLILAEAEKTGCKIISVPQGYTKCSTCVVSENAIITADKPIFDACIAHNIDSLLITEGHIDLPSYDYGFVGGASGSCGDSVYFCGDITKHPDGERTVEFCKNHGKMVISLSDQRLFDVGTILFI